MHARHAVGACLAVLALLVAAPAAMAEVFTVTRTDDPAPAACLPADCSLREAVAASNASTAVDDQIVVPASSVPYAVDLEALAVSDQVEIRGAGAGRTVLDGDGNNVIFTVASPGVVIDGLTVSGGEGGFQNNGELTLRRVSVERNIRLTAGGGIQSNGPVIIESSFIGFNQGGSTAGGGIQANGAVTLINSTMAANTTNGTSAINGNAAVTISSSAIVSNTTSSLTDAGVRGSPLTVRDSIFADNRNSVGLLNCDAPPTSLGGNVEDAAACAVGPADRPNVNPGLGPLELHGGTTLVYSLQQGSPAIDFAGACPPLDQRGAPRPQRAACDSGPFELEPPPLPPALDRDLAMVLAKRKLLLSSRGVVRVSLTCPATEASPPCSGWVRLRTAAPSRSGGGMEAMSAPGLLQVRFRNSRKVPFAISAGQTKAVAIRLPRRVAESLRVSAMARKSVVVVAEARDAAGNTQQIKARARGIVVRR
jgi:hypothetical protein